MKNNVLSILLYRFIYYFLLFFLSLSSVLFLIFIFFLVLDFFYGNINSTFDDRYLRYLFGSFLFSLFAAVILTSNLGIKIWRKGLF